MISQTNTQDSTNDVDNAEDRLSTGTSRPKKQCDDIQLVQSTIVDQRFNLFDHMMNHWEFTARKLSFLRICWISAISDPMNGFCLLSCTGITQEVQLLGIQVFLLVHWDCWEFNDVDYWWSMINTVSLVAEHWDIKQTRCWFLSHPDQALLINKEELEQSTLKCFLHSVNSAEGFMNIHVLHLSHLELDSSFNSRVVFIFALLIRVSSKFLL